MSDKKIPMPRFVTVLTEGDIDDEMKQAIEKQGYELVRHSDYEGFVTNQFKLKGIVHVA